MITAVTYSAVALGADTGGRSLTVANLCWDVGGLGTLILGIWLALDVDGYEVWDGWILGAIVVWAFATESGRRARVEFDVRGRRGARVAHALAANGARDRPARAHGLEAGRVSALAAIRPDSWELPLFLHVLGRDGARRRARAGGHVAGAAPAAPAPPPALRLGYRSLLLASIPAWLVMRVAAQWLADEENRRGPRRGLDQHRLLDLGELARCS